MRGPTPPPPPATARPRRWSALLLAAAASGCAAQAATTPPPAWWTQPPPSRDTLYFAGDATGAGDEGMARDLAYAKALTQLTTYLGADVVSTFDSKEASRGGVEAQEVELSVTVSGAPRTLRRVRLDKVETRAGAGGFDGYVLVAWPRAEYEAVLAADRNQAEAALAAYLAAETAAERRDFTGALQSLGAAQGALGTGSAPLPLTHPTLRDTGVLRAAMDALRTRVGAEDAAHAKVCAVGLRCTKDGASVACRGSRLGVVRDAIAKGGRQIAADGLPEPMLVALLESGAVSAEDARRLGRCVVAVQLGAELLEAGQPFTFVRTGARAVLYDSAAGKITWSDEIVPTKVGHVSYDGAMNKGFDELEKALAPRLSAALGGK